MNSGMSGLLIGEVVGLKVLGSFGSLGIAVAVAAGACHASPASPSRGGTSAAAGSYTTLNAGSAISQLTRIQVIVAPSILYLCLLLLLHLLTQVY
jgi:hypothetical protein